MSVNVSVIVLVSCMVSLLLLVLAKQDAYLHPLLVGGWRRWFVAFIAMVPEAVGWVPDLSHAPTKSSRQKPSMALQTCRDHGQY